ncbi:MAG TPA: hypothetical protein VI583_08825 [Cyclobacteriaceae bacterium]|nr:hypothetical protein [Cyclobacteriaceae bacterium]
MNKISSGILLLMLFLYQAGFYLFYLTEKYRIANDWEGNFEGNGHELLSKSIPITLPYQPDQEEFQPVLEIIEANGRFYRVIMQKYAKDTLHIIYQSDKNSEELHASLVNWIDSISQQSSAEKKPVERHRLEKNYLPAFNCVQPILTMDTNPDFKFKFGGILLNNSPEIPEPPPEATSSQA